MSTYCSTLMQLKKKNVTYLLEPKVYHTDTYNKQQIVLNLMLVG